jgi:hypothetical protein
LLGQRTAADLLKLGQLIEQRFSLEFQCSRPPFQKPALDNSLEFTVMGSSKSSMKTCHAVAERFTHASLGRSGGRSISRLWKIAHEKQFRGTLTGHKCYESKNNID